MWHLENSSTHCERGMKKANNVWPTLWKSFDLMEPLKGLWDSWRSLDHTPGTASLREGDKEGFHWHSWESAGIPSVLWRYLFWGVKSETNCGYWFPFSLRAFGMNVRSKFCFLDDKHLHLVTEIKVSEKSDRKSPYKVVRESNEVLKGRGVALKGFDLVLLGMCLVIQFKILPSVLRDTKE